MAKKKIIQRILFGLLWVVIMAGLTTLLVAANRKGNVATCAGVMISLYGGEELMIEEKDILKSLERMNEGPFEGLELAGVKLKSLELGLENDQWVRNAELYFDRENVLHIQVEERVPIARVITVSGSSFYVDSSLHVMPLLTKGPIRLPLITNFPINNKISRDSAWREGLKELAYTVYSVPFWNAQAGQIDILPNGEVEIIPVIGDHVIRVGQPIGAKAKLERGSVFYQQVLAKAGPTKYATIDLRFEGQVVGVHKGPVSPIDSIQLKKNIEELMKKDSTTLINL